MFNYILQWWPSCISDSYKGKLFCRGPSKALDNFLSRKDEKYVDYSSNFQIVLEACFQIIHFLIKQFQKSTNIFI
jgi:hypothetical protein